MSSSVVQAKPFDPSAQALNLNIWKCAFNSGALLRSLNRKKSWGEPKLIHSRSPIPQTHKSVIIKYYSILAIFLCYYLYMFVKCICIYCHKVKPLFSVLSIIEFYNHESRRGFVGRNNNKTFLISSQTRVTDTLRYQFQSQTNHLNLQLLYVCRLPASANQLSGLRWALLTSLVETTTLPGESTSPLAKWYNDLLNKTGYKFRPFDFDFVPDDSLLRTMESIKTVVELQMPLLDPQNTTTKSTPLPEMLLNCSRLTFLNITSLCFTSERHIAEIFSHKAFAVNYILQNTTRQDMQQDIHVSRPWYVSESLCTSLL